MKDIHGHCDARFDAVRRVFAESFARGDEIGASVSVCFRGERVVDLWGGLADRKTKRPWVADTVGLMFSSTKGLVGTCFLMLADRGLLDYDAPVARYWPEFARGGKADVTVRTLLSHRAGLIALDGSWRLDDIDGDALVDRLGAQAPLWPPGTAQGYHGVTFGLYAQALFKRVAGESIGSFFEREVRAPLGVDVWLGLPDAIEPRVARLYPATTRERVAQLAPLVIKKSTAEGRTLRALIRGNSDTGKAFRDPIDLGPKSIEAFDSRRARALELPWCNAVGNARALATVYAALIGVGPEGVRLASPETLALATARQSWSEQDRVLHKPMGFSVGFVKDEPHLFSPSVEAFGHPGAGGCLGWADPILGFTMGYVMNRMDARIRSPRAVALAAAVRDSIARVGDGSGQSATRAAS